MSRMKRNRKGQGALEYLLMIGAAVLVVAIVIIAISGVLTSTGDQNTTNDYNNQMSGLKGLILNLSSDPKAQEPTSVFQTEKEVKIQGIYFKES